MPALPAILHRSQPMDCLERSGKLTLIRIAQGSRDIGHSAGGGQKQGGGGDPHGTPVSQVRSGEKN